MGGETALTVGRVWGESGEAGRDAWGRALWVCLGCSEPTGVGVVRPEPAFQRAICLLSAEWHGAAKKGHVG